MKKSVSIFILCSIFLTTFFGQEAIASGYKSSVIIHSDNTHSSGYIFHKTLVISEVSTELEDAENKFSSDFQIPDFKLFFFSLNDIKNQLKKFYFSSQSSIRKNQLPIFLSSRSIKI